MPRSPEAVWRGHCSIPGREFQLPFSRCYGAQAVSANASHEISHMRNVIQPCHLKDNLVPRAHVPFGQHQDTELWNNQFPETKILGLPVSRRMRGLVYMASRNKVDVDTFHKGIQYALEKLEKSKFGFERTAVSNFKKQKTLGLWERACWLFQSSVSWCWPKGTWALGTRLS